MTRFLVSVTMIFASVLVPAEDPDRDSIDRFILAIQLSDAERVEEMVDRGFPVNIRLPMAGDPTPLHLVAAGPDTEIARFLMDAGADLYAYDREKNTPFMVALRSGNWQIVDYMIDEHGYEIDTKVGPLIDTGFREIASPLTYAAMNGARQTVTYLLEKGAGEALAAEMLLHATVARQFDVVERYASTDFGLNRPVPKYNRSTALHVANENGDLEMVRFLLDRGADLLARNGGSMTPFDVSVALGLHDLSHVYLEDYGYDIDEPGPFNRTALFYVTLPDENIEAVRFLLENGADPNLLQHDGSNYLHVYFSEKTRAGEPANRELIRLYLEHGFDPNKPDAAGYTFVHTLATQPDSSLFDLLDGVNLQLNVTEDLIGATPVNFAIQTGNLETAQRLLEMGADPGIPYESGGTILSVAVKNSREESVRLLVRFGASLVAVDPDGSSPLEYASDEFRERIADLIEKPAP